MKTASCLIELIEPLRFTCFYYNLISRCSKILGITSYSNKLEEILLALLQQQQADKERVIRFVSFKLRIDFLTQQIDLR